MNMFSYYITTYFITSNKDYNSCRNSHLVYQTYLKGSKVYQITNYELVNNLTLLFTCINNGNNDKQTI